MVGVLVYVFLYSCLFICVLVSVYLYLPTVVAACFQHEEWVFASTVTSNYSHVYLCVCMLYFVFVFHISSGLRNDYGTTEVSLRRHYGARSLARRLPCLDSRWLGHGICGAFSNQLFIALYLSLSMIWVLVFVSLYLYLCLDSRWLGHRIKAVLFQIRLSARQTTSIHYQ